MTRSTWILVAILLVVGGFCAGFQSGARYKELAWRAADAERLETQARDREAEIARGQEASAALQTELQLQAIANDKLQEAFNAYKRQHPLLVDRPRQPLGPEAPREAAAAVDQVQPGPLPAGGGPALTRGAVWMWNSALFGRDVPAGACGLADASAGACAADSGVTLLRAWDNQALNARTCAEDRLRHQRLIDYIQGKQNTP